MIRRHAAGMALCCACSFAGTAHGQHEHHAAHPAEPTAQVLVTINPEARVSAMRGADLPPPARCGTPVELAVTIRNEGFVTAPLRARIMESDRPRVTLTLDPTPLSGRGEEQRILRLTPTGATIASSVTIAFSISDEIGDPAGHDQIDLIVRCLP